MTRPAHIGGAPPSGAILSATIAVRSLLRRAQLLLRRNPLASIAPCTPIAHNRRLHEKAMAMRRIASILALFELCPLAARAGDLPVSATVQVTSAGIPILIVARPSFGVIDPLVLRQTSTSLPAGHFDLRAVPAETLFLPQATAMVRHRSRLDADSIDADAAGADFGRDGARHAVRDTMADHRRTGPPRHFMDALLVLRIDGYSNSPTLDVSGGVAGALWQVSQQR